MALDYSINTLTTLSPAVYVKKYVKLSGLMMFPTPSSAPLIPPLDTGLDWMSPTPPVDMMPPTPHVNWMPTEPPEGWMPPTLDSDEGTIFPLDFGPHNSPMPSPFKFNLMISKVISIPSYISLIMFSILTFYIIFKHFKRLLNIYLSVLFYILSQVLLLLVLSISWITELTGSEEETEFGCQIKQGFQTFCLLLPGYCIFIITAVRSIFVTFPLSYFDYIKRRNQLISFSIAVLICGLIVAAPSLGLCSAVVNSSWLHERDEVMTYCSFDDKGKTECKIFYSIVATIGIILPFIGTVFLYFYMCKLAVGARKIHRSLTKTSTSVSTSGGDQSDKEQRTIPWSIIAILGMSLTTTLPWAGMIVYTVEITEMLAEGGDLSVVFDVFYSVLQVLIGCSPLVYLLTTNSLRKAVFRILRKKLQCR